MIETDNSLVTIPIHKVHLLLVVLISTTLTDAMHVGVSLLVYVQKATQWESYGVKPAHPVLYRCTTTFHQQIRSLRICMMYNPYPYP